MIRDWIMIGLICLVVVGGILGIAALGSYLIYGDATCAFAHCIKVIR